MGRTSSRIVVIGSGPAAAVHTEAVAATRGAQVTADVDDADGVIVAVPPAQVAEVLRRVPVGQATLVESPVGPLDGSRGDALAESTAEDGGGHQFWERRATMTGTALLHAEVVRRGLSAIADLAARSEVHHLVLRVRSPGPTTTADRADLPAPALEALAELLPVLLSAAASPVLSAQGSTDEYGMTMRFRLGDSREVGVEVKWCDGGPREADLEAASADGVVSLTLWPRPVLEIDGTLVADSTDDHPLVALGFVHQVARLLAVTNGEPAWPPLSVGVGVLSAIKAALESAGAGTGSEGPRGAFCPVR